MTRISSSTSYAIYPTKSALTALLAKSANLTERDLNDNDVATAVLKVNIYYADLQYDLLTESPAISIIGLLGTVGGTFGNQKSASLILILFF